MTPPEAELPAVPGPAASKSTSSAERRVHTRHLFRTAAKLSDGSGVLVDARTLDVSLGGLAISANINPPTGTVFQIAFYVPGKRGASELFTASVRVMYSAYAADQGRFKIGLQFTKLDPAPEKLLKTFLS